MSLRLDLDAIGSATFILSPIVLGIAALRTATPRRWVIALLAAPAVLIGLAFTVAVFRDGPGYGGVFLLLYGPGVFCLGGCGLLRARFRG